MVILIPSSAFAESTRAERRSINEGNKNYKERKFVEAESFYLEALKVNPASAEAKYNLGLSRIRQISNPADTSAVNKDKIEKAKQSLSEVASMVKEKPGLAAKANYNLGNLEFNAKDYAKAIDFYKQALRIDPNDEIARKNLRIAQKNLKNQDQNKNQNKNQDQKKDQDKDQDKNQNQQNQNDNPDKKDEDKKDQENLSQQTAASILQAVDNKENQTRARVNKANNGKKAQGNAGSNRRW